MEEIKKENNMLKPNSIEKRDKYNCFDGAIACCMFIVMQFVFELVYGALPNSFKQSLLVALFASFLVEAIFVFAAYIPAKTRNINFFNATKLNKKPTIKSAALAVAISIISLICFSGLTNVFSEVLTKFGYKSAASFSVPNLFVYFIYIFLICICPAIFEDILFRGCILNSLKKFGDKKAIIISAIIFMLMHGGPDQTVHQFIIGIVLGAAYISSGSLWVPIIIHFTNNFIALTLGYITRNATITPVVPTWGQILMDLAYAVIFAVIGVYLIYFCIISLKKDSTKKEEQSENIESLEDNQKEQEEKQTNLTESMQKAEINNKEKKKTIILYVLAGVYLIFNWIVALIAGLL